MSKKDNRNKKSEQAKTDPVQDNQVLVAELTTDLQRIRADFENYHKRTEQEKEQARKNGSDAMLMKILPVIDTIDRAITHVPEDLEDNQWVKGIVSAKKSVDKVLNSLDVVRVDASPGTEFNAEVHEAIQFDEDSEGDTEVVAEELQSGYMHSGRPIRHAMVRVTKK